MTTPNTKELTMDTHAEELARARWYAYAIDRTIHELVECEERKDAAMYETHRPGAPPITPEVDKHLVALQRACDVAHERHHNADGMSHVVAEHFLELTRHLGPITEPSGLRDGAYDHPYWDDTPPPAK